MYCATGLKFSVGLRILIIRVSDILHFIISWRYYQLAGYYHPLIYQNLLRNYFFLKLRS